MILECRFEPQNLVINIKINGKPEKTIVDNSVLISVINRKLANSLTPPLNIGKEVKLKGVAEK